MAGLLDFFGNGWDDPKSNAVMALAGGLLDGDFASGMKGYANVMAGAGEANYQKAMQKAKLEEMQAMTMAKQDAVKQAQLKAEEGKRIQGLVANSGRSRMGMGEPSILNETLPEGMRVAPIQQQGVDVDYNDLYKQGVPFDILKDLAATRNLGREEVARVQDIEGQGGAKILQGFDKYGRPVGQGATGYLAPQLVNQGDKQSFVKPVAGVSLQMGQTPDSKASNALGWANHGISAANLNLSRQRLAMDKGAADKLSWNNDLGGFVNPRTREVLPAIGQDGKPVSSMKEKALTEDQGKAVGWLVQAENAYKNMNAATANTPSAAKPGFNDVLAGIPSLGVTSGVANMMRGDERQKFMQGASSLSEALLRAATGAGVNKDEAAQKIRELTPQFGDSDATIKQKNQAIPSYIESLKVRAGAGAKKAEGINDKVNAGNIVDKMPTANASNRGQRIRDTETGKILKSNGMTWVAE